MKGTTQPEKRNGLPEIGHHEVRRHPRFREIITVKTGYQPPRLTPMAETALFLAMEPEEKPGHMVVPVIGGLAMTAIVVARLPL